MEYPKINSLYKREGCGPFDESKKRSMCDLQKKSRHSPIIMGKYACEEFSAINKWSVTEKVDGTNIRICIASTSTPVSDTRPVVRFGGRTDNAQIPTHLLLYLQDTFTREKMGDIFQGSNPVMLFGEGYGAKIQSGGYYRKDSAFILFDVYCDGWWLNRENVADVAEKLGIDHCQNLKCGSNDFWTTQEIVDYVKSKPKSTIAKVEDRVMEGIVARSEPQMLFRKPPLICDDPLTYANYHVPVMFKLKCKDFEVCR